MGKIQTNADYIRSMSDEELAAYILNFKNTYGEEYEGESSFLEWLQEEKENSTRRLTKVYGDGTYGAADDLPCGENSYEYKGMLLKSLGKYEDAEEQGLLLRLPCKVGDTVYFRTYDCNGTVDLGIQPHKVTDIVWNAIARGEYTDVGLLPGQYGVSWFLTREEAEAALEAMNDD